ncbi:MAG: thioether cross-link-forming SCIFF peptide maturase [Selenomonadaceae bacterium]|nr:thioether cross-link-forming SCIFF peptide maturase [Selenomonadaceae bacterium]
MLKNKIHKFKKFDDYILLDINSGAVHIVDEMIFDIMDTFDGKNDLEVVANLKNKYSVDDLNEALGELHELINEKLLFAPNINIPPTFADSGIVKSLCLMVAQDCNLRCKYCFGDGGSYGGKRAIMTEEIGKKAVDFIIDHSKNRRHCEIDFFGGEPLINFKTVKAVTEYVRQREAETNKIFKLTLTTNGMLLDDDKIKWLNENNISLVLSLDGRKEIHDSMRPDSTGHGSYDRALKNFLKLIESRNGENYYLRGTYTKNNLDFTNDVLDLNDKGFDILSVEPVVLKDNPLGFTENDLDRINEEYDRLTAAYLDRQRIGKGFFFFHFNVDLSNGPCVAKRLSGCGAGHEYFAVDVNGDLYPCHQFVGREKYKLGDILNGVDDPKNLTNYFRQSHVLNKPKCKECWARFFCSGGCHANADLFNDDIRKPYEIGCEIQKKRLECAIYIQAVMNEN